MKKTLIKIFAVVFAALLAASCSEDKEKTSINMTPQQLEESFNKAAEDTGFRLTDITENDDGTFEIASKYSGVSVSGTAENGEITSIEVESTGVFEPTLPTYDYMVYIMMVCDDTVKFDGADKFIADLFYEAYYGGEEVVAAYNGLQYAFQKTPECFWFRIRNN